MNNVTITKTETEVLGMMAKGNSSKMIASIRKCSVRTIEQNRKNICLKLGARNCAEVISIAKDQKLI